MAILETATKYLLSMITENEEVKKFPKDFITASMLWIRSWFLVDDPKMEDKLKDPDRDIENKKGLIEGKLEILMENEDFRIALEKQLKLLEENNLLISSKNVVKNSTINASGDVTIGDNSKGSSNFYTNKNILDNSQIQSGGNVKIGD